jgi:hypothetical protein
MVHRHARLGAWACQIDVVIGPVWYETNVPEFEVIAERGRFVLGEEEDSYGIWDLDNPDDEPIERFPRTDEGFEAAWERTRSLWRTSIDLWGRRLAVAAVAGVILWLIGGVLTAVAFAIPLHDGSDLVFRIAQIADTAGYRFAVGALLVLGTLAILRRRSPERGGSAAAPAELPDGIDRAMWGVLVSGLVLWIAASAIASTYESSFGVGLVDFPDPPTTLQRVASGVQIVAYNLWLGSAVIIGLRLLLRWRRATGEGSVTIPEPGPRPRTPPAET